MGKALLSSIILIITVIVAVILYSKVLARYDETFELLIFLGLVTFFLGIGIFISGCFWERSIRESKS